MPRDELVGGIVAMLTEIQNNLYSRALAMQKANTVELKSDAEFREFFQPDDEQGRSTGGGFAKCWFASEAEVQGLLDELKVTIRCIPLDAPSGAGVCLFTGKSTTTQAIFAKSY
jgi:prolyl-tRNA synthetase